MISLVNVEDVIEVKNRRHDMINSHNVIEQTTESIFDFINKLNYKTLDHRFGRNIEDFDLAKDKKKYVKAIYTVYHYEKDAHIFLIELTKMSDKLITYIVKKFEGLYNRLLFIFTTGIDTKIIFPDREITESCDRNLIIKSIDYNKFNAESIRLTGNDINHIGIGRIWKTAFNNANIIDTVKVSSGLLFGSY